MLTVLNQILLLPKRFDANEWYILLNIVVGYTFVIVLPKRFPGTISVLIVLFTMTLAILTDHAIAGPPLDLYDINDYKEYELFDVITYFMYTPYGWVAAYVYDKLKPKGWYLTAFIVLWSLLAVFFEWLAVICHVFIYNNWNLFYSFCVYLVNSTLYLSFFIFLSRYFKKNSIVKRVPQEKNAT